MMNTIKKRNGEMVDFDAKKIETAVSKAMQNVYGDSNVKGAKDIADHVVRHLEKQFADSIPCVEDVQNQVEKTLMEAGHFDIAKAYIVYRYEHRKMREEEQKTIRSKIQEKKLTVTKRSGKKEIFMPEKLKIALLRTIEKEPHLKKKYFGTSEKHNFDNEILPILSETRNDDEGVSDEDTVRRSDEVVAKMVKLQSKECFSEVPFNIDRILELCYQSLYDGMETRKISQTLILSARCLIEKDPAYSFLAAKMLLREIQEEVIPDTRQYEEVFIKNIQQGVQKQKLDPRLLDFDLKKLSQALCRERDNLLQYLGVQTLADRYLLRNPETKEWLETVQAFFMRVAMGLAINEPQRDSAAIEFYNAMSTLRFMPSTPTLFHAGTVHAQMSSCYLTTVADSLDHIFKSIADNARLSKWSGGIGNDWTNVRATGSHIKGTGVESQGVIPFLKIANDTTVAINRSGRRRGATCAYLEVWHYDIEDFLELRKNTGDERRRTHDMNTAAWVPDLFMKRVRNFGDWTLFSTDETPDLHDLYGKAFEKRYEEYEEMAKKGRMHIFKKIKAVDLWKKMIAMLFETGHPWITFKDPSNIRSPQDHAGVVHSSNLCTEITLNTSVDETAVCNLGSLNLSRHITEGKLDNLLMENTVKTAIRMLDNVIDLNFYPIPEAKNANMKHRPVGLGIMGFADTLFALDIPFDSDECEDFADESMEMIAKCAISASCELAKERGAYETFKGSKWDRGIFPVDTLDLLEKERGEKIDIPRAGKLDWSNIRDSVKRFGMRNSNCLSVAPTATIANIAGVFPSIEPLYKNLYVKSNLSGEFIINNPYLVEDLKKLKLWNEEMIEEIKRQDGSIQHIEMIPRSIREKYKETFEIDAKRMIRIAARRGKWIDQSQSLNLYTKGASGNGISDMYFYSWELGLKTTYYLRTLAASGIEKSTIALERQARPLAETNLPAGAGQPVGQTGIPAGMGKACFIADPSCEACQ